MKGYERIGNADSTSLTGGGEVKIYIAIDPKEL